MMIRMPVQHVLTFTVLAAAALAGCQQSRLSLAEPEAVSYPPGTISLQHLAGRLGLSVTEITSTHAVLRNPGNCVMVFLDPDGQVYVNGKRVGPSGGISRVQGIIFLPANIEPLIRGVLRPYGTPPQTISRRCRVVLDPGHGGKDPGAISRMTGMTEKVVNLTIANEAAEILARRGVEVKMTRRADVYLDLDERCEIANRWDADLFVSIHADSCRNPSARGFTVYNCRGASAASCTAANCVEQALSGPRTPSRGVRQADYRVLVATRCPAILVEVGYLSNPQDAALLADGEYRSRSAKSIAEGIMTFIEKHWRPE
jgi:N-acetylmuramoyl-L-alanine amidase